MSEKVKALLEGKGGNYIFPFFWQHGETEEVLRTYMRVIHEANIGAVCVESRPHPDFCGEQWWHDMDIILEEAKKYGMKVWILDESFSDRICQRGDERSADRVISSEYHMQTI